MWHLLTQWGKAWLKLHFNNNPVLFDTGNYFSKLGQAVQVWLIILVVLFALAVVGCIIIVLGALNSWF